MTIWLVIVVLARSWSAVAGGVTSMVCLPNTDPVIDDVATVEFVARRARKNGLAKVYPYAAATKQLEGEELAEIGMLAEAGALGFTPMPATSTRSSCIFRKTPILPAAA